jgi:hypothetical protein
VNFALTADQQLLKNAARTFLDAHCSPALVRSLADDPRGESDTLRKRMLSVYRERNEDPAAFRVTSRYVVAIARRRR